MHKISKTGREYADHHLDQEGAGFFLPQGRPLMAGKYEYWTPSDRYRFLFSGPGRVESWRGNPIEQPLSVSGVSPFVPV